ncbi:hypothetical protein LZ30DRAFT_87163 [Colletotrichum cereale]|nr:hypothetical protein LZ30DRAFT_87163 [Colletotrichum cereale]
MIWVCVGFISLCLWDLKSAVGHGTQPPTPSTPFALHFRTTFLDITNLGVGSPVSRRDNLPPPPSLPPSHRRLGTSYHATPHYTTRSATQNVPGPSIIPTGVSLLLRIPFTGGLWPAEMFSSPWRKTMAAIGNTPPFFI